MEEWVDAQYPTCCCRQVTLVDENIFSSCTGKFLLPLITTTTISDCSCSFTTAVVAAAVSVAAVVVHTDAEGVVERRDRVVDYGVASAGAPLRVVRQVVLHPHVVPTPETAVMHALASTK